MTVGQLLVYLPQLSERKATLSHMADKLQKTRFRAWIRTNLIEYEYANYDLELARADFKKTAAELARAQLALDVLNNSETTEIDL